MQLFLSPSDEGNMKNEEMSLVHSISISLSLSLSLFLCVRRRI